jgi:6-phosphogluconolactonase
VDFFCGDERAVPPDHPDSNYRMAHEALLCHLGLDPQRVHRMEAERADREAAALDYESALARVLAPAPGAPPPALDLVLLGMGADGHTLSLFPHTAALHETSRWVVANHVPKLNADRLTMTAGLVNAAARVVFLVAGDDKAAPLAEVLEGPSDPERLPSQLIRPGRLLFLVDRKAAARLGQSTPEIM